MMTYHRSLDQYAPRVKQGAIGGEPDFLLIIDAQVIENELRHNSPDHKKQD